MHSPFLSHTGPCLCLHCTKLHSSITFATLLLLQHLKAHFPTTCRSSDNTILFNFKAMVKRNLLWGSTGPYPTYSLQMVSKKVITSTATVNGTICANVLLQD